MVGEEGPSLGPGREVFPPWVLPWFPHSNSEPLSPQAVPAPVSCELGENKEVSCQHFLAWAEKPSEVLKTKVASFFWWGLSALAFMEELDSQVFCVLCTCCQCISER